MYRALLRASAKEAGLGEGGHAGEPFLPDAEPVLHRCVAIHGPQRPVAHGCRGEVTDVEVGRGVAVPRGPSARCVDAWLYCTFWDTAPSVHMVVGRSWEWPSSPATMRSAPLGPGGVFCKMKFSETIQSALSSSALLLWEVGRGNQKGCSVCRPRKLRLSLSLYMGSWFTALAALAGTSVLLVWSACRRTWSMTLASTVWTHGLWVPYCTGREAPLPSLSGTVPRMATAHVQARSAARATAVACLQGLPPDASEDVWPQASGIQ